jgi:thiol-disulfide isomerase/thioredoxin
MLLLATACASASDTTSGGSVASGATVPASAEGTTSSVDPPLPAVALTTFEGDPIDLRDLVGTPLVVNFWASWCPPCAAEMPDFEAVHQLVGDDVRFVGININDDPGLADDLAERTGVTYQLLRDPDGATFAATGGIGMPTTLFVDAAGGVVGGHTGLLTRDGLIGEIESQLGVTVPG